MDFDLTTSEGRQKASNAFKSYGWTIWPAGWLAAKAFDWLSSSKALEEQKEIAIELIKAGSEHGVKKMNITLDRSAGFGLGSKVHGIPIKVDVKDSGKVTVGVTYKSSSAVHDAEKNTMTVVIFSEDGLTPIDSIIEESFISFEMIDANTAVVMSRVKRSHRFPDGVCRTRFSIEPHNKHAMQLQKWRSSES